MDERKLAHANHPFRQSDGAILIMAVVMVISMLVTTFGSIIAALGHGLASTPEHPVHWTSNVGWIVSGTAFVPIMIAFILALVSRQKLWGNVLGLVILISGVAMMLAEWVSVAKGRANLSITEAPFFPFMLIPLLAAAIVFWQARKLN